jgi:death-on-curing protein
MSEPEPVWIRPDVVRAIHRRQIAEHGGADGIRDEGLLASALDRPRNLHAYGDPRPDLAALAAAYGYGIARNHPFVDGNKRTALVLTRLFLALNGAAFTASATSKYETMMRLAAGDLSEDAFAAWVRAHLG